MKKRITLQLLFVCLLCVSTSCSLDHYTNYLDENGRVSFSKNYSDNTSDDDNIWIEIQYLGDPPGYSSHTYIYKNVRGFIITKITISRSCSSKEIPILNSHVEIRSNNILKNFKSIEIMNKNYDKKIETISYSSEREYLRTNPVMNDEYFTLYEIYYLYSYDDFKDVNEANIKVELKLLIDGKEKIISLEKRIKRDDKRDIFFWFGV